MALQKTPININFVKGLETKTDPYQIPMDSFLQLQNSVFTTGGRLTKRNGFASRTILPNSAATTLTTLNDNLIATGSNLYAFSEESNQWINQGTVQPVDLNVQPLVRVSTSQSSPDSVVSASGLVCLAYIDNAIAYYQISDSLTGQQIVKRTTLPNAAKNPRVFLLGNYFVITFGATVSGSPHIQFIAVPLNSPTTPLTAVDITTVPSAAAAAYDGIVLNNALYISFNASDGGGAIRATSVTATLAVTASSIIASGSQANLISVTTDSNLLYTSYFVLSGNVGKAVVYTTGGIVQPGSPATLFTSVPITELTNTAVNGVMTTFYEVANNYSSTGAYPTANIKTDYISKVTVTSAGVVGTPVVVLRSVGLASKAFIDANDTTYMIVTYGTTQSSASDSSNQPSYFLMDSSGNIFMRLAYSNGGGYAASQVLPSVSTQNNTHYVSYLIVDFLATANKGTNLPTGTPVSAIYTQTGINLASFSINTTGQQSSEIAGALHLTGGQIWEYDTVKPVESNFQVWPENIATTTTTTTGHLTAQPYYYVFTYEWTDAQGELIRSAPSIPVLIDLTGAGTSTNKNTLYVPTLRMTYKTSPNPVRIVGYRWSIAQQIYYQFTSLTSPTINDTTVDYITIVDTLADSSILGNVILYTTGGVIENIAPPAAIDSALFNNRLWLIDAEDRNLLWYSKQVIESTPVEMSDLLTIYVAPTTGAQGSTGPMTALSAMDDKLIIFKRDAIYYINGTGPDNTGANSSYSDPVFITSAVGCTNRDSIVLTPSGIMFQSDKGIWLLGRGLDTQYIGAPVEIYNSNLVKSAQTIPGTNQVRFIMEDNRITLMYDYFYGQWGTFTNISAISATLWQGFHTYLNSFGVIFQESLGSYVDGSDPVLLSLTSAWINLAGLQGLERFYFANLLGTYFTPFKLNVTLAYDYNSSSQQSIIVTPNNYAGTWGSQAVWGSSPPWGGSSGNVFTARLFPQKQKCQSFQISIQEVFDNSFGVQAGQGLTLSGLSIIVGVKKGFRTQSANKSFG